MAVGEGDCMVNEYGMACHALTDILVERVKDVIRRSGCECIALSGGVDTTLIAVLAEHLGMRLRGYSAAYLPGTPRDLPYVNYLEKVLGIKVTYVLLDRDYVSREVGRVKSCVDVEDDYVELRNDIVFYSVLVKALEDGCKCVYTGSGGDELFAGYRFMVRSGDDVIRSLRLKYALSGRYPELIIGKCLGVRVVAPYLEPEVIDVALRIPPRCLRDNLMRGKEVLRQALTKLGVWLIADRVKTPAEAGAGTDKLTKL